MVAPPHGASLIEATSKLARPIVEACVASLSSYRSHIAAVLVQFGHSQGTIKYLYWQLAPATAKLWPKTGLAQRCSCIEI